MQNDSGLSTMRHRHWSAFSMILAVVALLGGTALTIDVAVRRISHEPAPMMLNDTELGDLFQELASSTFRDAPSPLSRW
jgi:hypothetical protein